MINKLSGLIIKRYKLILVLSLVVFILSLLIAVKVGMDSNMENILPHDSKSVNASNEYGKYFSSQDNVLVVVKGKSEDCESFMEALSNKLLTDRTANSVLYKFDLSSLNNYLHLYIDTESYRKLDVQLNDINSELSNFLQNKDLSSLSLLFQKRFETVPPGRQESLLNQFSKLIDSNVELTYEEQRELFSTLLFGEVELPDAKEEFITSPAKDIYLMIIKPNIDMKNFVGSVGDFFKALQHSIEDTKTTGNYSLEVGITGGALVQDHEADNAMFNNFYGTAILTFIIIILFVVISFRRLVLPLTSAYPLLLGAVLSTAVAYMLYRNLNMFSVSFAVLLLGLGIDFAVHILSRYMEERSSGLNTAEAVSNTIAKTGPGMIIGAVTTAVAFLAFLSAKFKAFTQMGVISGAGILILCAVMLLVIPSIIMLMDYGKQSKTAVKASEYRFLRPIGKIIERKPGAFIAGVLALCILLMGNVLKSDIKTDMSKIYPQDMECLEWLKLVEEEFGYNPTSLLFMVDTVEELEKVTAELSKREDIRKVDSILEYLPKDQDYKLQVVKKYNNALRSKNSAVSKNLPTGIMPIDERNLLLREDKLSIEKLPESLKENFVGKEGKLSLEVMPAVNIWENENFIRIQQSIIEASGNTPVGMPVIMNEVTHYVKNDVLRISIFCLTAIFIILFLIFKNFKAALTTMLPLAATICLTLGILPLLGSELNIFSIIAFPILIGIGIDSSVHLKHRMKSSPDSDIPHILSHTGKAIMMTNLTTLIGFGSLCFVNHPGLASFGFTVVIGMIVCLIITLTLLPSLYLVLFRR
jgi:uncharacterized protein